MTEFFRECHYRQGLKQRAKAISREPGIGGTAAASWDEKTATLAIYNAGFGDPDKIARYLYHEIGHSTVQEKQVGKFLHLPPPEWMALSDWKFSTRKNLAADLNVPTGEVETKLGLNRQTEVVLNFPKPVLIGNRMVVKDKYDDSIPAVQFFHYAAAHDREFVSDYARSHPAEDLAESFSFYMLHPDSTQSLLDVEPSGAPNKWKYLVAHYPERPKR